ncbi:MAG: YIP1 family protein [Bacteroidales bacterium]|nr:YIP1 family protein [Bacteroidales bacterium]
MKFAVIQTLNYQFVDQFWMRINEIYLTTINLVKEPLITWGQIYKENKVKAKLINDFLIPMSILIGVTTLFGNIFGGIVQASVSFSYIVASSIISFLLVFLEVYLAGWIIFMVAENFNPSVDSNKIFNLVIYSHTPVFLSMAFVKIFPQLYFVSLIGLYSIYIYWTGIELFSGFKSERKIIFMILSGIVTIVLYLFLSYIFNWIYDALINEFTNFVSQL